MGPHVDAVPNWDAVPHSDVAPHDNVAPENLSGLSFMTDSIPHETIKDYAIASGVGKVVKSFCGTTTNMGRRCTSDYAIVKLERCLPEENDNFPGDDVLTSGCLFSLTWDDNPTTITELQYDVYVKKRCRTSGITHGLVTGVYGTFQGSRQISSGILGFS